VSTEILGARTPAQLTDNLGAGRLTLSAGDLQALDGVSALAPE
jgi:aryl-alcohol dehydrogenase-like predicted oxidoreductase